MNTNILGVERRQICPFKEKCYRLNPIHFREMIHPHLEKLVINQLDSSINISDDLDFECSDREKLLNQLKIVQQILKTERKKDENILIETHENAGNTTVLQTCEVSPSIDSKNLLPAEMREKIERNRQAAKLRRMQKLQKMDHDAAILRTVTSPSSPLNESRKRKQDDSTKKLEMYVENVCREQKKTKTVNTCDAYNSSELSSPSSSTFVKKVPKHSENTNDHNRSTNRNKETIHNSSSQIPGTSYTSSDGQSIIEKYQICKTGKEREIVRNTVIKTMEKMGIKTSLAKPGEFAMKHALAAPYYLFFSRVMDSKPTHRENLSVTFPELLDKSLGEIETSLHINFMIDVGWLCLQYMLADQPTNLLLLMGERCDDDSQPLPNNIRTVVIPMSNRYGTHHSKMSILKYTNGGIRIIISTANLYADDWENRTQGVWVSPHLPPLPSSANSNDGESPTGFKKDILKYLFSYSNSVIVEWISAIRMADCSDINVFFVASIPGSHKGIDIHTWGLKKVAKVLSQHTSLPPESAYWPIVAQSSSIGSLGANFNAWLTTNVIAAMSMEKNKGMKSQPNFQLIYPTINNYKQSYDCRVATCCLPYSISLHSKQVWLESYLYQWKADYFSRTQAMPHIKSYTRISPSFDEIAWFILTSANLSKAAWGSGNNNSHYIMNYEAGVLFIPNYIIKKNTFPIKVNSVEIPTFPIPYDLPLKRYNEHDKPFVVEFFQNINDY